MSPVQRRLLLGGALVLTLVAVYWVEDDAPPPQQATPRPAREPQRSLPAEKPLLSEPPSLLREVAVPDLNPFRKHSWFVAPPPPPPPKPSAPPLPFQYVGKTIEEGEIRVFLNYQGKHWVAQVGDQISGMYRVEEIKGGSMLFRYLPLDEVQRLAIGTEK